MAWDESNGYRDRYMGGRRTLRNAARAWAFAKEGLVPVNIFTNNQREGSSFDYDPLILDYDFDDMDGLYLFNKAANGEDVRLTVDGGEWVYDDEYCMSGVSTSGVYGNIRGRADTITRFAKITKSFTFDMWIRSHDLTTTGPPRIFSLAPTTSGTTGHGPNTPDAFYRRNISLLQGSTTSPYSGNHLQLRTRLDDGSESALNGTAPPPAVASNDLSVGELQHVAVAVRAVQDAEDACRVLVTIFVDGEEQASEIQDVSVPFSEIFENWADATDGGYLLSLFDETALPGVNAGRGWKGTMYRFRFWRAYLNQSLIQQLYDFGPKGALNCNWGGGGAAIGDLTPQQGNPFTPPLAQDDSATVYFGEQKVIDVLSNDIVYAGKNFRLGSLQVVDAPASGTATVSNGTITYSCIDYADTTPQGIDTFTYKVKDTANLWTSATVSVTVASGAGDSFVPTIPFTGGTYYPGRYEDKPGANPQFGPKPATVDFSGGPASGALVDACGITWTIPWKSTVGPNNDYYKIENFGSQTAPDVELSGFNLLYPGIDSQGGGIQITQPGVYENFVSYKKIQIKAHDVTLRNFVVDPCVDNGDAATAALIWQKQNSVGWDKNFWSINKYNYDAPGPCPLKGAVNSQGKYVWQERQPNSCLYSIDCNTVGGVEVSGTTIEDGFITWGSSKCLLMRDHSLVRRCEISNTGADAGEFNGDFISFNQNHVHHMGCMAGSHADGFQDQGGRNHIMLGNFLDMPKTGNTAPYNSNAAFISSATKRNVCNIAVIGNWINAGSNSIYAGTGQKWDNGFATLAVDASASDSCVFSLNGPQFSATPETARAIIAGPELVLEKYVVKGSSEAWWEEVPQNLWTLLDNSTIVLSGDSSRATPWEPITYAPNDPYAGNTGYISTYGSSDYGCLCPRQESQAYSYWFDFGDWNTYNNNPGGWQGTDCDWFVTGRACDILFKPTLEGENTVFTDENSSGKYGQLGPYRLLNPAKCAIKGRWDDGNVVNNRYHPKFVSGIMIADNRFGDAFDNGLVSISHTHQCVGDFEWDNPKNETGTFSSMIGSGNVWDVTDQLIGSATGGYNPDYNAIYANNGNVVKINDSCMPASGNDYGVPSIDRLRSQGWCSEFDGGMTFVDPSFTMGQPPHCPDPWCP